MSAAVPGSGTAAPPVATVPDGEPGPSSEGGPEGGPEADRKALARSILAILFRDRRLIPGFDEGLPADAPAEREFEVHYPRLLGILARGAAVHLVLPAFPAKSANPLKTLGDRPDFGEWLGLSRLQGLADDIAAIYAPGARCTICSDGRVFGDLVGVADEAVTRYREDLRAMIARLGADRLSVFDLDAVLDIPDYALMREELLVCHAESLIALRQRTRAEPAAKALFNGIHRFVFEDMLHRRPSSSRNEVRNEAKRVAYRVIQRSNAWSRLIAARFPDALRLSIHPQPRISEKIGVHLVPTADPWGTPWHTAVIRDEDGYRLVPRAEAERRDALLVYRDGRPSHFVMPGMPTLGEAAG